MKQKVRVRSQLTGKIFGMLLSDLFNLRKLGTLWTESTRMIVIDWKNIGNVEKISIFWCNVIYSIWENWESDAKSD